MADLDTKTIIANTWRELGLSEVAIAGLMGRAQRESSFRLDAVRKNDAGKGKHSVGLFQWNRERLTALKNYAKEKGTDYTDARTQAEFTYKELSSTEGKALKKLQSAKTVQDAVDGAMMYTRPRGSATKVDGKWVMTPRKGMHYTETLDAADKFYSGKDPTAKTRNNDDVRAFIDPTIDAKHYNAATAAGVGTSADSITANSEAIAKASQNPVSSLSAILGVAGDILGTQKKQEKGPELPTLSEVKSMFGPRLTWQGL